MKIFIVGRGHYALNLIYALDNKYEINLITTDKTDYVQYISKIKNYFIIDYQSELEYVKGIKEIALNNLVIPVGEEGIIIEKIINLYPEIDINLFCSTSKTNIKYYYHNKRNFYDLLKKLNIDHLFYENILNVEYDNYLLKQIYSRGGLKQIKINNEEEFKKLKCNKNIQTDYLVQKYINITSEYSVFLYANNGIIHGYLSYQTFDMISGFSTRRKIITNNKIYDMILKIIKHISYSGFAGFDIISDGFNLYIVDFNPRIVNGISFLKMNSFDPYKINNKFEIYTDEIISLIPYLYNNPKKWINILNISNDMFKNFYDSIKIIIRFLYILIIYKFNSKNIKNLIENNLITCNN